MSNQEIPYHPLLNQLQELQFAVNEIRLYLDTHPNDPRAICDFQRYTYQLNNLMVNYQQMMGPMFGMMYSPSSPSLWVDGPWPWELEYNV